MDQREHERRDAQQHGKRQQQSSNEVPRHGSRDDVRNAPGEASQATPTVSQSSSPSRFIALARPCRVRPSSCGRGRSMPGVARQRRGDLPALEHAARGVERQHARRRELAPGQHLPDVSGADAPTRRRDERQARDDVLQLADVAWPAVPRERGQRVGAEHGPLADFAAASGARTRWRFLECPRHARARPAAGCERPPDGTTDPREIARGRLRPSAAGWSPPARGRPPRAARSRQAGESRAPAVRGAASPVRAATAR